MEASRTSDGTARQIAPREVAKILPHDALAFCVVQPFHAGQRALDDELQLSTGPLAHVMATATR